MVSVILSGHDLIVGASLCGLGLNPGADILSLGADEASHGLGGDAVTGEFASFPRGAFGVAPPRGRNPDVGRTTKEVRNYGHGFPLE
jgi:hypothetical protein